ncbi:GTP-binding protein [Poseidonocella sp. HB161398]|uniref:CobW family GTP-binding protein n=1 Tax=Poseidonocella sp. HB161398 TaxID=2320855 RepID=UPI0011098C68|nr:GTP-binding protein [Poseidonocella sp. HB161398]
MTDPLDTPLPAVILTGFLGAGKTTLLARLLRAPESPRMAVLVNDFGEINLDAELVTEIAGEDVLALQNGCICCTIQDDLVGAIETVLAQEPRPERLVIEASGVSRPLQIAAVFEDPRLEGRVALDAVLCLVDCGSFADLDAASTDLAMDQVAGSDLAILNKCDQAEPAAIDRIEAQLRAQQPRLHSLRTTRAEIPLDLLTGLAPARDGLPAADHACGPDCGHGHHHHHHDHAAEFASWSWQGNADMDPAQLRKAIRALPQGLLRGKGVFRGTGGQRLVFDLVGKRRELRTEPGPLPARSSIVLLARSGVIEPAALEALLEAGRAVPPG